MRVSFSTQKSFSSIKTISQNRPGSIQRQKETRKEKFLKWMHSVGISKPNPSVGRKPFCINTYFCWGELETIQEVMKNNEWWEAFHSTMEGHLMWFGLSLRDNDLALIKKRTKMFFNWFVGLEFLARKKELSIILSRMNRYFSVDYDFVPTEFLVPEQD